MKKRILLVLVVIVLAVALFGCAPGLPPDSDNGSSGSDAVSPVDSFM